MGTTVDAPDATADFSEAVALVTGAGGGIGRAVARMLAARGARVMVADRRADAAAKVASELGDAACPLELDVRDGAAFTTLVQELAAAGRLDVLVNNAGVTGQPMPLHEMTDRAFDLLFDVNVRGVFHGMRAALPVMLAQGAGTIVNVSSVSAAKAVPGLTAYGASKRAVIGLTKGAAAEVAGSGVRVNAVLPGPTATPMVGTPDSENGRAYVHRVPLGRLSTAEEQAEIVCFLASARAGFVTGEIVLADGGMTL